MNIYDIAKEAGVSITTVSRVLNNKEGVNAKTRERVAAVLKNHDYKPSAIARGMVSKSLRTVAVLTIDIREPHYARTAYTIEREFSRCGYEVMICNTGGEMKETRRYLEIVLGKNVDGIILVGSIFNEIGKEPKIREMLSSVPVVLANGKLELENSYSVLVDDQYGVMLGVEHLAERGYKEIYYVTDADTNSAKEKMKGFIGAMTRCGYSDAKQRIIKTDQSIAGGKEAARTLLSSKEQVSAIVCGNDITAVGVLKELLERGKKVPEEVAVIGYNNSEYARICHPQLTTVDNKAELVALMSVQLLTRLMEKTEEYSSAVIRPELIVGKTT